jgi:hypothetical protein
VAAIELDPRVEAELDTRAVRRLIQLELSEIAVPPPGGEIEAALFVRVLPGEETQLRVELWERGEFHGARLVSIVRGGTSVMARRVALVAAELARGLRNRRRAQAAEAERARRRLAREERIRRARTRDGPEALRAGAEWTHVPHLWLAGPTLDLELHAFGATRVDVGGAWAYGLLTPGRTRAEAMTFRVGPSRRLVLGRTMDLDFGLRAEAALLTLSGVEGVDQMPGERVSWSARAMVFARFERRLTRALRLDLGVLGGLMLRRVPVLLGDGRELRLGGGALGAELGVVFTPET